jgi:hypothetical protein
VWLLLQWLLVPKCQPQAAQQQGRRCRLAPRVLLLFLSVWGGLERPC